MREKLTLPADRNSLADVSELVERYAGFVHLSVTELHDVQVAVAEACTNAIVHGLHEDSSRTFEFEIESDYNTLTITIRENGTPYVMEEVAPVDLTSTWMNRKIGGLGIYLINELMDSAKFSTEPGGLKVVRMTKNAKRVG